MRLKIYSLKNVSILISYLISFLFIFIGIFQIKNYDTIVIKLGMSHFFSPSHVDLITWLIISLNFIVSIFILFFNNKFANILTLLLFFFYIGYSSALIYSTNSFCGCGNIFIDFDLRFQIGIGILLCICLILFNFKKSNM